MAEWPIASDLKSEELKDSVSSNLTLSFFMPILFLTKSFYSSVKSTSIILGLMLEALVTFAIEFCKASNTKN